MNKSKLAKALDVSRPTLYKMIKEDGIEYWTLRAEERNLLNFQSQHNRFSPLELDSILEWLSDNGCLSKRGQDFYNKFYQLLIKEQ